MPIMEMSVNAFVDEVASSSPAPGGGSVSALAAALGSALTSMVCRLTIGKKKYADAEALLKKTLETSESLRARLTSLIEEDTRAFNEVMRAYGMVKSTEREKSEREKKIQEAAAAATVVPLQVMELCADAMDLTKTVAEKGNPNSISDAGVSALLLQAACSGAALNVRINLGSIRDEAFAQSCRKRVNLAADRVRRRSDEITAIMDAILPPA